MSFMQSQDKNPFETQQVNKEIITSGGDLHHNNNRQSSRALRKRTTESEARVQYQNIVQKQHHLLDAELSFNSYVNNPTQRVVKKTPNARQSAQSVLGQQLLNMTPQLNISIEEVVKQQNMKQNAGFQSNYYPRLPETNSKMSTRGFNHTRTPSLMAALNLVQGRYSSTNRSPMPSSDFGIKGSKVQQQTNKAEALTNVIESPDQIEKQDYDLENYSFHNKRQSDQGSMISHKNSSLLKNEILRKQQLPLNLNVEIKGSMNDMKKELNQKIEKKQFELQKAMQLPQSNQRINHTSDLKISKKTYRKDGKRIGDLLNYKDYALDQTSMPVIANKVLDQSFDYQEEERRILKNSYHPQKNKIDQQLRARSQIKIPDVLKGIQTERNKEAQRESFSAFHITDLLDNKKKIKSRIVQQQIDQKPKEEKNEYVIKNYRVISKQKREFFLPMTQQNSPQRNVNPFKLATTAPQSPIRLSNSIISPNTYHFSSKLSPTNMMAWNNSNTMTALNKANETVITKSENTIDQGNFSNFLAQKTQAIKIKDDRQAEDQALEFDHNQEIDVVNINYKDVISSWMDSSLIKTKSQGNEFEDLMQRAPSVSKIFNQASSDSLDVENEMILKMKPKQEMYKDLMMGSTIEQKSKNTNTIEAGNGSNLSNMNLNEEPYGHLKARNVFKDLADEFQQQIEFCLQNPDTRTKVRMIIDLTKDFLTHMEKQVLSADRLPLELFDDFISENEVIKKRIEERARLNKSPLKAKAYYFRLNGDKEHADARVLGYDDAKKKFLVEFQSQGKTLTKYAGRLNLHFVDYETSEQIEKRREQAISLRKEAQSKLLAERLFINELAKKYSYLKLPRKFKQNIKKRLVIDLQKFNPDKVKLLVIQVEALFVFSILKSIIYCQIGDPYITRIVAQYQIEDDFEGKSKQHPYYALKAYEDENGRLEKLLNKDDARLILQNYAIAGKKSFIDAIQFLIIQNEEIVVKTPIFEYPVSQNLIMYVLGQDEFKGKSTDKYKLKLRQFPTQMTNFIKTQRIIARRFKETLEVRWTENIASKIEKIVDKEFDQNSREIQRKTLNPYVIKLFELIRLFQEKNLYDKLQQTLEQYLRFLLQFAIRDKDFVNTQQYKQYQFEYFRVLMNSKPMIKVEVKIKKISIIPPQEKKEAQNQQKKVGFSDQRRSVINVNAINQVYEITTKPQLGDLWTDFIGLIDLFVNSVSRIRRIDEIVLPQLKLKKNTLRQPEIDQDEKFEQLSRMINLIIDSMKAKPDKRIQKLQKYLQHLQLTFDQLIFDLKKKSFDDQNSVSDVDSADDQKAFDLGDRNAQDQIDREQKFFQDAYKNVEITEDVYKEKFSELRKVYWDVQLNVDNEYDFGIIALSCSSFKAIVVNHLDKLIKRLSKYVVTDFLTKMNNLYNQFESIEKKITDRVETIDEVIHLIDYIEKIQRPNDLLEELENFLNVIKNKKDFIDDASLRLLDTDFQKYLNLFGYPVKLERLLNSKKQELENLRTKLSEQMNREKEKIIRKINSFRESLDDFKTIGLNKPDVLSFNLSALQNPDQPETKAVEGSKITTQQQTPVKQSEPSLNRFLFQNRKRSSVYSKQSKEEEDVFVPEKVLEMADKMEKLKIDLENTEQECEIINRREKLLNMRVTKFTQIALLQTEIKPFVSLWAIAAQYTRVYEDWLHGSFYDLNSDKMEDDINEWWKQLTRISKTHISTYEEPMEMLNYLIEQLEKFKEYMPMITALRSKGLEKRHWQMLSKQLGFEIEPLNLTLQKLIDNQMYEGKRLDIIKGVSEIAIKEYAIKTTLEALEHELRIMEFQPVKYKDSSTFYLKALDDLITVFEESSIKILALKSNQYAKHFMDKILRVEKELKVIVDVLDEWVKAQKSWVYLEPIFQQQDIAKQMINESTKFIALDTFYKREVSHINLDPVVQRYCRKDGLITQLQYVNKEFEAITKSLSFYLESKREYFSRFYFLSNEEIIEILGSMREPRNVQKFLNKIFEGIDYLGFIPNGEITGIFSKEDEYVQLRNPIQSSESAENWLKVLEYEMKESVKYVIHQSLVDVRMRDFQSWIKTWQGQAVIVVMNIILTDTLNDIFANQQTYRLKDVLKQVQFEIESLAKMIRTKLDQNTRMTITSLLTNRVHSRDNLKQMIDTNVQYASDFLWKLKMKYEYKLQSNKEEPLTQSRTEMLMKLDLEEITTETQPDQKADSKRGNEITPKNASSPRTNQENMSQSKKFIDPLLINDKEKELQLPKEKEVYSLDVSMIDAQRPYGYEYLGNTQRIVITPLTDRCYRSLFMALHFNYGGCPEGPVGTGKTETTKDLSKCLAKQCFVFNCSSSLNFIAMTKFFKGLATSGAWSCFDEFNRIDLQVLSVISQIIIIIQGAIRENRDELVFEDSPILFNKDCAIFITMNPQYIGRTELPDNLKSLFRPVAMIVPDSALISEILLYSYGFLQAKPLARKIVRAFNLAKQQLSNQIHYDFGLRTIKIVLQIAGLMKLKASGVIEPDFKIKEGKKKRKEDKSSSMNVQESSMTVSDQSPIKRKKSLAKKNKSNILSQIVKKNTMIARKNTDSSLEDDQAIIYDRRYSVDSEDFNHKVNLRFFKPKLNMSDDDSRLNSDSDDEYSMKKVDKDEEFLHNQMIYHRNIRSSKKFQDQRKSLLQGRIIKMMEKRLEFISEQTDEAKQTKKLMKVLGLNEEQAIEDEEKIEEFIVMRAINDTNVPKLQQQDTLIWQGITEDIFPSTLEAKIKYGSLTNMIEEQLHLKNLQVTSDYIQRVLHLYDSVMIRHGIMIVGSTLTGKTTSIQILQDTLNKSRDNEADERIQQYKIKKARRLGISNQDSSLDEDGFDQQNGIELTPEEIKMIRAQCRNKGVVTYTINPKSISLGQLMGTYDDSSHDWNDGIMAHVMRASSLDLSDKRKWVIFDGPIDPVWVENLNSVMDDNKKLTLSTGETIKMTGSMTIILEAEDLTNCTPATISRCAMIYMKEELIPLKGIINKWIKSLPSSLEECLPEIDLLSNYFISETLDNFIHQANLVSLFQITLKIYPVSQKWAVKNFCRYFNSLLCDYRSDKFNSSNATAFTIFNEQQLQNDEVKDPLSAKLSTVLGKRPYHVQFSDIDTRFQNALRNKTMWIQSFFLFSIVWAFGSVLKASVRKEFERQIRAKILCNTEEISAIASLKSKIVKKNEGKSTFAGSNAGDRSNKNKQNEIGERFEPTPEFKEPEKPPYFLCPLPPTYSLFEIYFDLETNQWHYWDNIKSSYKQQSDEDTKFKKRNSLFNVFIPTIETIRMSYIIEANILCKNSMILIGPTGAGKSWLTREVCFRQLPSITSKYKCSSIVFSNNSTADKIQHFIDSRLDRRRKGVYGPPFTFKYIFFIDDIMMPFKDEFGVQPANELLRQWFDFQGWYDHKSLEFKKIEDIQFLSCITVYESHKNAVSSRNEWHWAYLGVLNTDERHYIQMFTQIMDTYTGNWPQVIQGAPILSVVKATMDLYAYFERHVKPTPSKFFYIYNTRHMFKILYGMAEIEHSYLQTEFELAKLWIHESWRTLCDRIADYADRKILFGKITELARKHFKIGKNKFTKKIGYPYFCPFNKGQDGVYTEVEDMKETTINLRKYLFEYNEINKKSKINIVLFEFLVEFLIKIYRLIKQPFSHGIMIGIEGSGKHQLAQIATFLAGFQLYQIKLQANYTKDDWYADLKNILTTAGVDQKEIVFHMKHNEILKEDFLDDINTLVNNGEIQGLYAKEEYENIISQTQIRLGTLGNDKNTVNNQSILADFSQKCRENLKILLNFTPTGANLRSRIRNYKSLVNCSTLIWMDAWPQEGFREVAFTFLKDDELINRDVIIEIAINIHSDTIQTAKNYFFETQHYLYTTPHAFKDFITSYKTLYEQKRKSLKDLQERYEIGLERLKNTQDQVEKYQEQLENNSPMLVEKQIEIERLLELLKEEHINVGKRKEMLMQEEEELNVQREEAERIKEECEYNLNKATPELFSAISALQNLSKNEINELRTLKNPPSAVKLLMEGVCLLLKIEPIKFKGKDGIGFVKDFWAAATGKHVLGNPKLQEILVQFDHTQLDQETMVSVEELAQNPEFVYDNVARASKAARGLFLWIQALKNYYYIYQETQPKRDALFYAEKQKQEKEDEIRVKMEEFKTLEDKLERLKQEHVIKEQEIRVLQKQIDECQLKKERATKLLNGLGGEKQKWLVCNRMIAKKFLTIQGDVLLGAAFITYLSAFTQKYREQCVEKWEQMIRGFGIRISDDFNFNKVFGDQIKIKEWNFNGLPSDSFSISNAIVLENSIKQCICIDPQYQASKWIRLQEMSQQKPLLTSDLKILNFSDVNFNQQFEFAMKFGKKVLIENVGQKIDLVLYPVLKKDFVQESGTQSVNMFGHMVDIDSNFRLFITSEMKTPHFGPDIAVICSFVNFYVTLEGLEEQMLSIVISNQKSELEEETIRMKKEALDYIKVLKQLEDDILESLSKDIDSILSDEHLIETLNISKKTGRQIAENLQKVNKASNKILKSRGIYTPAAYRAALLFFLVSDLSKIEIMYQFSLKWYIEIFTEEVKQKKHTDQDPLLDIIRNFTYTLYKNVCQSIFEKDKLLFTFLLAFRILEGENCLNMKLFDFFIKGPQLKQFANDDTLNESESEQSESSIDQDHEDDRNQKREEDKQRRQRCPWISDQQWKALESLAKIPPFHRPNLADHFLANSEQWHAYIFGKDSDNVQMPGNYHEYDFEKDLRQQISIKEGFDKIEKNKKDKKRSTKQQENLKEIKEVDEENEKLDENIWGLDNEDQPDDSTKKDHDTNNENSIDGFKDEREQVADSLVLGVSEYNEFRLGSVRFEKEMNTKKQQVFRDLLKFCIIRIFRPERIVRDVQRFLGSVLDPRFMEPPVFNLSTQFKETSCYAPILFILGPNINTLNELQNLKYQIQSDSVKIEYMPLGSNINEKVQHLIVKSAIQGHWVLLENLHLVLDWIPTLEKFIQTMYKEDKREYFEDSDSEYEALKIEQYGDGSNQSHINQFPELRGVRINPKFRLWLSSMPVDNFPIGFLQQCLKITLQPAQGIRQNALKILNSINYEFLQKCAKRQNDFRKLFFALSIFHSVVVERTRFGSIGWSQPYLFSENDFLISSLQLQELMSQVQSKDQPLPLELIRYLVGTLNYGGRITKKQDEITLDAILNTFICENTTKEPNYKLTGIHSKDQGIYFVPGECDLQAIKIHISKFPISDRTDIFGLHENATIMRATNEGKTLLERMFELEFASKEIVKSSTIIDEENNLQKYQSIKKKIQVIIEQLPELLDEDLCRQKYPIAYEHCINILLTKEIQRYNMLLQVIYVSLKNTLKALEGVIHINNVLEEIYKALTYEQVPKTWFKYSYPSYKSLTLFLQNLKERTGFIRNWLTDKHPFCFWLPGFFDQQSFLTMLLQQKARQEKIPIDLLAIDYHVLKKNYGNRGIPVNPPSDGCYAFGLWIEGASWNDESSLVSDCDAKQVYQEIPYIHLKVIKQVDFEQKYMNVRYYQCPLYLVAQRERLDLEFSKGMVATIPLPIADNSHPSFWIKRGTALLCQREE